MKSKECWEEIRGSQHSGVIDAETSSKNSKGRHVSSSAHNGNKSSLLAIKAPKHAIATGKTRRPCIVMGNGDGLSPTTEAKLKRCPPREIPTKRCQKSTNYNNKSNSNQEASSSTTKEQKDGNRYDAIINHLAQSRASLSNRRRRSKKDRTDDDKRRRSQRHSVSSMRSDSISTAPRRNTVQNRQFSGRFLVTPQSDIVPKSPMRLRNSNSSCESIRNNTQLIPQEFLDEMKWLQRENESLRKQLKKTNEKAVFSTHQEQGKKSDVRNKNIPSSITCGSGSHSSNGSSHHSTSTIKRELLLHGSSSFAKRKASFWSREKAAAAAAESCNIQRGMLGASEIHDNFVKADMQKHKCFQQSSSSMVSFDAIGSKINVVVPVTATDDTSANTHINKRESLIKRTSSWRSVSAFWSREKASTSVTTDGERTMIVLERQQTRNQHLEKTASPSLLLARSVASALEKEKSYRRFISTDNLITNSINPKESSSHHS